MELRPYQQEAREAIFEQWDGGVLKTLLILPTGCGKTIVFAKVTEDCVRRGGSGPDTGAPWRTFGAGCR